MASPLRLFRYALVLALVIAAGGFTWEVARFGLTNATAAAHLEQEVRARIDGDSNMLRALGAAVASETQLLTDAAASRDRLPALFDRLASLAGPADEGRISATVYVPAGAGGNYRVLAWSDGPAGAIARNRLADPAAVFVARGASGVRLVALRPVESDGRRIAVVATETVLSPVSQTGASTIETSFGAVTIIPPYVGAGENLTGATEFVIAGSTGAPLLEVHFSPETLPAERWAFRRRVLALALLPLLGAVLFLIEPLLDRRRRATHVGSWIVWSLVPAAVVGAESACLAWLLRWIGAGGAAAPAVLGLGALGVVAIIPGGLWWRRSARLFPARRPFAFVLEQLLVGLWLTASLWLIGRLLSFAIVRATPEAWPFALFPFEAQNTFVLTAVLATVLALMWGAASLLAAAAFRWRVGLNRARTVAVAACVCWLLPAATMLGPGRHVASMPMGGSIGAAVALALFALTAGRIRRHYRRTTESARLVLGLVALFAPLAIAYPIMASTEDTVTRAVIERDYAPATASHPETLAAQLAHAETEIDAQLPQLLSTLSQLSGLPHPTDSHTAFEVWSQTNLSRSRVVSDVELYGADRALVSRFALNLPEYLYRASQRRWPGKSCEWESFGEVTRFGAADRSVIHAERGLCLPDGQLIGAVVVHIAPNDYEALPFLSSANPYYEMLGMASGPATDSRVSDLQVVVYGWSFQPIFASGHVAWAIPESVFLRLYQSGEPFWTSLSADGRTYHVYFSENRAGIYALGYTTPTLFEHAERLGEIAALTGLFFVLVQIALTVQAALVRRRSGHLRALFNEVRTSFYRKLFLAFVLVGVAPVLLFAFAFATYMTAKFRADVVSEASSVVSVAHRVLDELAAAGQRPDTPLTPLSDDMMVWIRQVVDQDVNVFNGPDLVATSQRDLLDSGLLPTRTPAAVYRAVALDQLPTFATEDRLGDSSYLVAAAPVTSLGRDAVLSVPLASRQREIDREIDDLDRGVLVGSVLVVLFAAALGASVARRVSDPVARLTKATRQIAAGRLDVRIAASTADELRRLVDDFNTMTGTLRTQRAELARTNQIKAWNEMARQVAHEIKNPLTPIQLSAEHLQRVHEDQGRPLGAVFDQCLRTILGQVRLLRQIASEFSNFAAESTPRPEAVALAPLLESIVESYRLGLGARIVFSVHAPADLPAVWADRTFLSRALTNLVENAVQAMPSSGSLDVSARREADGVTLTIADTGVGMDDTALARAFEPYFSTKTGGSGLGLANAKRNIERQNGSIRIASRLGEGTTLTITLPSAAGRPAATEAG